MKRHGEIVNSCRIPFQRIRGYFYNEMRYINLRFTYLLTYLLTLPFGNPKPKALSILAQAQSPIWATIVTELSTLATATRPLQSRIRQLGLYSRRL